MVKVKNKDQQCFQLVVHSALRQENIDNKTFSQCKAIRTVEKRVEFREHWVPSVSQSYRQIWKID